MNEFQEPLSVTPSSLRGPYKDVMTTREAGLSGRHQAVKTSEWLRREGHINEEDFPLSHKQPLAFRRLGHSVQFVKS